MEMADISGLGSVIRITANGESVEIIKRGKNFARLTPAAATPATPAKVDFKRQLRAVWGAKSLSPAAVRAMREAELGSQS